MNRLIITLILILAEHLNTFAQNDFYFDKWKAKGEIVAEEILLILDSTNTEKGKEFNEKLGRLISENLKEKGIAASLTFNKDIVDVNVLTISFDMVKPAYVKLNTFGAEIPLCNRLEINQVNKLPVKKNRKIKTILAISVDKEESGLAQASTALADLIFETIKK